MKQSDNLRYRELPLRGESGAMPALGFGTLIPDPTETKNATVAALKAGFRHLDCAERYRNEEQVGEAIREDIQAGSLTRGDLFITTKLWNNNHRPERVRPAFESSRNKLHLDFIDLYLMHTPFAFQPGDDQDPRDQNGNVIYDEGISLMDTWRAMENLVTGGKCKAIGLSDVGLDKLQEIFIAGEDQARRGPGRVPSLSAANRASGILQNNGIVLLAFAPLGHGIRPGVLEDPVIGRDCAASQQDSRPGSARLGGTAGNCCSDDAEESRSREGEFRHLRSSRRRHAGDQ